MSGITSDWPLPYIPGNDDRVILASQGIRLWTAECRAGLFNGILKLACMDATTMENLRHQQRVAFTILNADSNRSIQGSGIVRFSGDESDGKSIIEVEPYRLSSKDGQTYELRLSGWKPMNEEAPLDFARWTFWYQAFRAVTLPMSALPVLVGATASFVYGQFNWLYLILALIGTILAHAGANAVADYFDFKKGVDSSKALSSHLGALARERVEPETILLAAFGCFLITALIGFVLVYFAGWPLLLFGLAGLMGAFFYTGRPLSYKYRGLGELTLGFLMGPVIVMGSFYLQTLSWNWVVFLISLALAMIVSSVSLANNLRDLPDDKSAGIATLPMMLGVTRTKYLYYFLTIFPYILVFVSIAVYSSFWPLVLVFASIPQAIKTLKALISTKNDIDDIRQKSQTTPYPLNSIRLYTRFAFLIVAGNIFAGLLVWLA